MQTNAIDSKALATQVMDWCQKLAAISSTPNNISRFYLTPEHKRCNALVSDWMQDAGMTSWSDAAGNLWGRYEAAASNSKTLLLGSHLDSIPNAGAYDGILGVLVAIASVQQLYQQDIKLPFAIEIIGFGDEEGSRFGSTLLGSRAVAGTWNPAWWELKDREGISLAEAFAKFGLKPELIASAARTRGDLLAYIEVHIEQGPVLEEGNNPLGVVTSIAGARRFTIDVQGYAGHAGTVPMTMRKDALLGAALGVALVERIAHEFSVVATVGQIECVPGAVNVIPGQARFSLDIRSGDDRKRDKALEKIRQELALICSARQLTHQWSEIHSAPAVGCADWLQHLQAQVLSEMGLEPVRLMSGAGHDAMAMVAIADVAMYFVRCKGGVSHHPDELVMVGDVELAIAALTKTLLKIAESI